MKIQWKFTLINLSNILLRLIDGENVTNSDEHMWLVPFSEGEPHIITVTFPERKLVTGIRVWNYNKSTEDTYRGVSSSLPVNLKLN